MYNLNEQRLFKYFKGLKMKRIIMTVLLASTSLMAAESVKMDGAKLYKQNCAICHGAEGKKVPKGGVDILAGKDATKLARSIRAYKDQDNEVGAYTMNKNSQVMKDATYELSREQIVAIATYLSEVK